MKTIKKQCQDVPRRILDKGVEDLPIADEGLKLRILICFLQADIKKVRHLVERKDEISGLKNMNKKWIKALERAIALWGGTIRFK